MIYFIDEEKSQVSPYVDALEVFGYSVKQYSNADSGLEALLLADDVEAVIVDVMMTAKDEPLSQFSADETENFLTTGLALLGKMVKQSNPEHLEGFFPKKTILFSMASQELLIKKIKSFTDKHEVSYFKKSDYPNPYRFAIAVKKIIEQN